MNRELSRPTITVSHGAVIQEVLDFTTRDFCGLLEEDTHSEIKVYGDYKFAVYNNDNIDSEHLDIVLCALEDHLDNIPDNELRTDIAADDYYCASPVHHDNDISCHCSLDDCIAVTVYSHIYYGPRCIVQCYYVTPAE